MIVLPLSILLFFVLQAWSAPLNITVQNPLARTSYSTRLDEDRAHQGIEQLHKSLLISSKSIESRNAPRPLTFNSKRIDVAGQIITRSIPVIDDLPVEGADGVYNDNNYANQFNYTHFALPKAAFRLSAAECLDIAIAHHHRSTMKNPYVEKTRGIYEPLWLMHFGELRPTFKIRLPTISIFDLKDIYVDADNGDILRIEDSAQMVSAPSSLFVYAPTSTGLNEVELKSVSLKNLVDLKENGFLRGEYMSVRNCCRYYTCPPTGECTDDQKKCARASHEGVRQSRELLALPTATLGLDPLITMPETISVDTVRCTYLPFARANYKSPNNRTLGFFETPIDEPGIESEMDRFSEIQAYFSMMSFFDNIRSLLNDNTWCLRTEAMSCNSDGSPVVDDKGNPVNPYRVFVNQLIPDMKLDGPHQSDPDNFLIQVLAGKGSLDNPIRLNQLTRIGNAAFVPALSTLKKSTPRADEILSDLIKPFDHNVFFQGERDFAYDGDVVFHEFMHAITTSLINKINSLGLDEWGIHSEPGGLNEAWSDYFAAAFTNDPKIGKYASIKGGYGEVALRNIDNTLSCPNDVIGEIHNDGMIWSGALWETRSEIKKNFGMNAAIDFDRSVLASLAEAKTTEDFKTQSEKLIKNITARQGLGEPAALIANQIFEKRGIKNCFRAYTLSSVDEKNHLQTRIKNLLFVPSKTQIGLKNYAPAASQLEIGIPAGAKGVTLSWRQFLGGTGALLGTETTPDSAKNIDPLGVLASLDVPIAWKFQGARSIPTTGGQEISNSPIKAHFSNGYWQAHLPLDFGRCEQKTMYISLLSTDFKYVLEGLNVQFDIDKSKDLSDCDFTGTLRNEGDNGHDDAVMACSTTGGSDSLLVLMLALIGWRQSRSGRARLQN